MNKLRRLAISIIEDLEEHIELCEEEDKKPFDEEEWYRIEDITYEKLKDYLIGDDELSLRNSEDNKHILIEKRINDNTKEIVDEVETNE